MRADASPASHASPALDSLDGLDVSADTKAVPRNLWIESPVVSRYDTRNFDFVAVVAGGDDLIDNFRPA